ncbi:MAG TPA: hypothetical protein PLN31_02000 [Azoarcus taiwanensis]|uniref:Transmembrane protein n=1 Tax=Azoarcus taiwanensis TaxID=666964 RepID=A0A972F7Q1_9RHOO|nr:hypothetical protein [Azoarcus taiwanensis]NMG03388.1 hypothetical protein [Azoarcus taiwanensis]HRQ56164.1 hypothetical protein [Azoarcus taiwanensis]
MYIIAIAWLYVVVLTAISNTTVIGGVLTFLLAGVGPLALFLWIFGTPARRRAAARRATTDIVDTNDRAESTREQ